MEDRKLHLSYIEKRINVFSMLIVMERFYMFKIVASGLILMA